MSVIQDDKIRKEKKAFFRNFENIPLHRNSITMLNTVINLKFSAFGSDAKMIQCKISEKTRNVIESINRKYSTGIKMDSSDTLFICNGRQINLDFTIGENEIDKYPYITIISDVQFA